MTIDEQLLDHERRLGAIEAKLGITPVPPPTPPAPSPAPTASLWLSTDEILRLPTSGAAWNAVKAAADAAPTKARLDDLNEPDNLRTLAAALVAARLPEAGYYSTYRRKVIDALDSCQTAKLSRALELSRNLAAYVIAADLIGYKPPAFLAWLDAVIQRTDLEGHSGGKGLWQTALRSANNWGTMARASAIAAYRLLGDSGRLVDLTTTHRRWLGENLASNLQWQTASGWHADRNFCRGINARGATIEGHNVDGVLPEEMRRSGFFKWPPPKENYVWSGLEGALVGHTLLVRAGLVSLHAGDSAMLRAYRWLYDVAKYPAEGDDRWQPWLVNKLFGAGTLPLPSQSQPGKLMGFTDWTHA